LIDAAIRSDPDGVGHGPIRRHFVWEEGLPHTRHSPLAQLFVGRKSALPRPRLRDGFQDSADGPGLTLALK
jgi:hypothetical protein